MTEDTLFHRSLASAGDFCFVEMQHIVLCGNFLGKLTQYILQQISVRSII